MSFVKPNETFVIFSLFPDDLQTKTIKKTTSRLIDSGIIDRFVVVSLSDMRLVNTLVCQQSSSALSVEYLGCVSL